MTTKPLMRYHGAKWRLAPWIISHFPQHHCYVEPFGGSAAVLISKEPSTREVYNDKNDEIVNLFNVIRCNNMRPELLRLLHMTPYSRTEFEWAKEPSYRNRDGHGKIESGYPAVMEAHKLLVRAQMGFGSAGATRGNTGFRLDTARSGTSLQSLWSDLPAKVLEVTERLRQVVIENTDAYNVIKQHDRSDTLANYLLNNLSDDWTRSSFADPIKEMLRVIGVDCSDEAKAVVDDTFGVTSRHMMQTLGTEWGRHMIDGDLWVKVFARLNAGMCVIVPDVRFENEAALVREHGVLIHLTGRGGIEGSHVSENALEFKPGDVVIDNSRDLAWLHGQVDSNSVLGGFVSEVSE